MAKVNFCNLAEVTGAICDEGSDGRLILTVETKDEIKEFDVLDLFQKLVGYEVNIKATLPMGD